MRRGSRQPGRYNGNRPAQQHQRPPQRNQTFDSNGPNIKIRGNAYQIFERYVALAREAETSGDRVAAENFYQHAEHYFRVSNTNREGSQQGPSPRPTTPADLETNSPQEGSGEVWVERPQPQSQSQSKPRWDDAPDPQEPPTP